MILDTDTQAETERYFGIRMDHPNPDQVLEILAHAGQGNPAEPGDELLSDFAS